MIRANLRSLSLLAGLWALAWAGCVTEVPPVDLGPQGSVRVVLVLPSSLPLDTVTRVEASAETAGIALLTRELEGAGRVWQGVLRSLPERQRSLFRVKAFDAAGALRFELEAASEELVPHRPALIILVAPDPGLSSPSGNRGPLIGRLVASAASVAPGGTVSLRAEVDEPGGAGSLQHEWEADGGTFDDPGALTPAWTAPAASGRRTLELRVRDSAGAQASLTFTLEVTSVGDSGLDGPVSYVQDRRPPTILAASPTARTAVPGELLKLNVAAEDPSGGALTFEWKANTGTLGVPVTIGNTSEVSWTALSCVPAGVEPTIEVKVTNPAGLSVRLFSQVAWSGPVCGHPPCALQLAQELLTLQEDCTTDTPVFIPEGLMLDGTGRELVAVDPVGGHFVGAILRNRGAEAHVRNLRLRAQRLLKEGPCDAGDDRLRGILLLGASGSVVDSEVSDIRRNQPSDGDPEGAPRGCQEGHAIEVRNSDATAQRRQVELLRNQVSGYQKVGILVAGGVDATLEDNVVTGAGPVASIAQNGVQLSDGATGRVTGNQVSGHSYTGSDVATGILVAGGASSGVAWVRDAVIQGNTLTGNDIGIYLAQAEADGSPPATPTRLQVLGNTLHNDAVTNGYPYQAGLADLGGGNTLHSNTFTGAGYDPATQPGATFDVDVVAGPASQVVFLTPPGMVTAGTCSARVVVQSQDAKGNMVKPAQAIFEFMASGDAATGLTFHAEPGCAEAAITTVELATPEATGAFYFKAAQPGAVTLTVSNGSLSGSQDQLLSAP